MANCKKISVDFHGVITAAPDFFRALMRIWRERGIMLYVVSGGPCESIKQYLAEYEIPYDELWCIFDYFNAQEKIEVAADGSFHIDDARWNAAKGAFCARAKIGLHIDNSTVYGKYFTTPYVWFDNRNRCFEVADTVLAMDAGAAKIADILSDYCINI